MFFYRKRKHGKSHSPSNKNKMTVIASTNPKWKAKKHFGLSEWEFDKLCGTIEPNVNINQIRVKKNYCYAY